MLFASTTPVAPTERRLMKIQTAMSITASALAALRRALLACAAATALFSCASDQRVDPAPSLPVPPLVEEAPEAASEAPSIPNIDTREEIIERGTGGFIGAARGRGAS